MKVYAASTHIINESRINAHFHTMELNWTELNTRTQLQFTTAGTTTTFGYILLSKIGFIALGSVTILPFTSFLCLLLSFFILCRNTQYTNDDVFNGIPYASLLKWNTIKMKRRFAELVAFCVCVCDVIELEWLGKMVTRDTKGNKREWRKGKQKWAKVESAFHLFLLVTELFFSSWWCGKKSNLPSNCTIFLFPEFILFCRRPSEFDYQIWLRITI